MFKEGDLNVFAMERFTWVTSGCGLGQEVQTLEMFANWCVDFNGINEHDGLFLLVHI